MKYVITLCVLIFALGCGGTKVKEIANDTPPIDGPEGLKAQLPVDRASETSGFSNSKKISQLMNFLASDELKGRDSGGEGIEKAARFIEKQFEENGVQTYYTTYRDTLSNFKKAAYNIIGIVPGNDEKLKDEFIIIGAHYDHIGLITAENGDAIANGANDNASGTSTVMEFARYFGKNKTNKRSLLFVLFSAEEKGLLGSKHLAKKMKAANLNLYAMLNFEMMGVPLKGKDYAMYVTGYKNSNLAEVCNVYANESLIGFLPRAREFGLFQRSDNYPFHLEFNVPSHTYCTFDFTNFNHYHKVGDEVDLMDFEHMATMVNKMIPVLEGIANAETQEIKMK